MSTIPTWHRYEAAIERDLPPGSDPLRDVQLHATFTSPSGRTTRAPAFWDGGKTWRVRFAPDAVGEWRYEWSSGGGGRFECVPYEGSNPFYRHGPIRTDRHAAHLVHADGTPWFFLADTVWNGPMLASRDEWQRYVSTRAGQRFTAAQFVSTQWRTATDGGPHGPAYEGGARLERVNPTFFQNLDRQLETLVDGGIAGVPVLLWAIKGGENKESNPGNVLSEEDCALLARYQVARWHAHPVVFILNGDGKYVDEEAARWRRIGRAVFGDTVRHERAPTMVHPGGQMWVGHEFKDEDWLDVIGYQSGHGDDEKAWRWIVEGPPATEWRNVPGKVVMNIESPYEDHISYQSKERHPAIHVRRANYWSLMVSPTAGVTYGGHGVWGWDPGGTTPVAHPYTGVSQRWSEALHLPGGEQMAHLYDAFTGVSWWKLRPAQELLREQPGAADVLRYVTAARAEDGSCAALYLAAGGDVRVDTTFLAEGLTATWLDPRDGTRTTGGAVERGTQTFSAPDTADWVLILA